MVQHILVVFYYEYNTVTRNYLLEPRIRCRSLFLEKQNRCLHDFYAKYGDLYLDDGEGGEKKNDESQDGQNNPGDSWARLPP